MCTVVHLCCDIIDFEMVSLVCVEYIGPIRAVACGGGGGGKGGNCPPPWDFQFLCFFKLIIPKSNTEIATWYLLRRHCPPAYLGQATALGPIEYPVQNHSSIPRLARDFRGLSEKKTGKDFKEEGEIGLKKVQDGQKKTPEI